MKLALTAFLFIAMLSHAAETPKAEKTFPEVYADFSDDKSTKITDMIKSEENMRDEWKSSLDVCWDAKRIVKCEAKNKKLTKKKIDVSCHKSHSALCQDPMCGFDPEELHGIVEADVLKGQFRDFLLLRGSQSGCGGIGYNVGIVDENNKVRCKLFVGASWESEEQWALAAKIYKNYKKYLFWPTQEKCEFKFSKKEKEILAQ